MWNTRKIDTTPFLRGYEKLLLDFGTDYQEMNHANISDEELKQFFGAAALSSTAQRTSIRPGRADGRLLSSSRTCPALTIRDMGRCSRRLPQLFDWRITKRAMSASSTIPSCTLGILFNGDRLIIVRQSTFELCGPHAC